MIELFKKRPSRKSINYQVIIASIRIDTVEDYHSFTTKCAELGMVPNFAISGVEMWDKREPTVNCFAIIKYVPASPLPIRVDFFEWVPNNVKRLGDMFEMASHNYISVQEFNDRFVKEALFKLLHKSYA